MKYKAFTLAEVLITLAIIGVVAAMTVPTLMTSTRGKEYEVAANKALSTLASATQMRYVMDGVNIADYYSCVVGGGTANCTTPSGQFKAVLDYLTLPPGFPDNIRPGDQAALPTIQGDEKGKGIRKLKDGSSIVFAWSGLIDGPYAGHFIGIDTNGEKGPTRSIVSGVGQIFNQGAWSMYDATDTPTRTYLRVKNAKVNTEIIESTTVDASEQNQNPDIVIFAIDPYSGAVKPAGQRTRNILATGNALISQ